MPVINFACPQCDQPIEAPEELANQLTECPTCKGTIEVPTRTPGTLPTQPLATLLPPPIPPSKPSVTRLIVTTGNEISGHTISEYLGIVRGVVVRSPDLGQQLFGGLKTFVGGNIESFTRVCEETRRQAFNRMVDQAKAIGADAIIAIRYDATEFAPGVTEVLAYGTAVRLANIQEQSESNRKSAVLPDSIADNRE